MRYKKSQKEGEKTEELFAKIVEHKNLGIRPASFSEQVSKHIDFFIINDNGSEYSVDVKGEKRISRSDKGTQDAFVWVEFKNVRGRKGWIYGEANYIAFEKGNQFIIVDRKKLATLCEEICDVENLVEKSKDALYKGYSRKGRQDLISIIHMSDIEKISSSSWDKV